MRRIPPLACRRALAAALVAVLWAAPAAAEAQQLQPQEAAMMALNSARRAYNDKKYAFAAQRFREFLQRYRGHKEAPAARYGLALSLLEAPTRDYKGAVEALRHVVGRKGFPDRPFALYHMGAALRAMGRRADARVAVNRRQAARHRRTAAGLFEQSAARQKQAQHLRARASQVQAAAAAKQKEAQNLRNTSARLIGKAAALQKQAEQLAKTSSRNSAKAAELRKEAERLAKASTQNAAKAAALRKEAERLAQATRRDASKGAAMLKEAARLRKTASPLLIKISAAQKQAEKLRKSVPQVVAQAGPLEKQAQQLRGAAQQSVAKADAKLREAPHLPAEAQRYFAEAAGSFSAAAAALSELAATATTGPAERAARMEWFARASCDACEMLLRTKKFKEAGERAAALLAKLPAGGKQPGAATETGAYRPAALYHLGYARLATKDYLAAGRALSRLAPFRQEFGVHARYLLARVHHLSDERPEAAAQYKAVLAGYEKQKAAAAVALRNPAKLDPERKAALEALVGVPPPEYILRAMFYIALLECEDGRYAHALEGFSGLIRKYPGCSLVPEARLRLGFCQMQVGSFPQAIGTLQALTGQRRLADRATWWMARATIARADPKNAKQYAKTLAGAIAALNRAADLAGRLAGSDPQAGIRRGDILLELGDTQQLAGQYRQAAATYQRALAEKSNPQRAQEAMQRQAAALHLAGDYANSDVICLKFEKAYPKSTLLAAVLFRSAENAYLTAAAAARNPRLPNREQQLDRLFGTAIARYRRVIEEYPDFPHVNQAREGMATAYYRLGRYSKAIARLAAIPPADRAGELAAAAYLLADCLIRTLPAETGDALAAARLVRQAGRAVKLLDGFLAVHGKRPEAPDALLKLGHCHQRIGALLAGGKERVKAFTLARAAYDRFLRQFAKHPRLPTALFERAKCLAAMGNRGGAIGELNGFRSDPLRRSWIAPLALLRLSALLRSRRAPAEAVKVIGPGRAYHEANLLRDPTRKDWVPALQYEHALAVKESGKPAEAKKMLDVLARQFPGRPEAVNAVWRAGQCRREELTSRLAEARRALAKPGAKPQEIQAADRRMTESLAGLRKTVDGLQAEAEKLARRAPGSQAHLRMHYETAWCYRVLAEAEIEGARRKLRREAMEELRKRPANRRPPGQAPAAPLRAVPPRVTEQAARDQYERLIAAAPGAALALQARFELAEMLAVRGDHDAALALLEQALQKNPPLRLAEQIRLRSAACFLAKNDPKAAHAHVRAVAGNPKTAFAAQARYLAGEVAIQQQDWAGAVKQLAAFRDDRRFQHVAGITDRALLRLAHACARARQWTQSRQALEALVQRFGVSPWVGDAFFGIGWAWQQLKQHDNAVRAYSEVTRRTAAEVAARAQLQIGLCRLEQKRYPEAAKALLVVPFTYGYARWSAPAWCEAGRAYMAMKQPAEAARMWKRVIKDYPTSRWAEAARKRLSEID